MKVKYKLEHPDGTPVVITIECSAYDAGHLLKSITPGHTGQGDTFRRLLEEAIAKANAAYEGRTFER